VGGQTSLKAAAAIQAGEEATLHIAWAPAAPEAQLLDRALGLVHQYGTLGGRSRNGWGSFVLRPANDQTPPPIDTLDARFTIGWHDGLARDWPHAIGKDDHGVLIWQTKPFADWKAVMRGLAEVKIDLRTQKAFTFTTGKDAASPDLRHWLAYPVTNHNVTSWKADRRDLRLPNSLRFKVRPTTDGQLRGVIFHVPCRPPPAFKPDLATIRQVWQRVHTFLDAAKNLERIAA
jgi:CRISPR-associated protein Cmr1